MQALIIRSHLKLMNIGLKNSQYSKRDMLNFAQRLTGKTYKNSKADTLRAIQDLAKVGGGSFL